MFSVPPSKQCLEWKKLSFGHTMALELSEQAYALCRELDASRLQEFLEAHSADIGLYLHEGEETTEDGTADSQRISLAWLFSTSLQSVCRCCLTLKQI
jgi:hypothetical protein